MNDEPDAPSTDTSREDQTNFSLEQDPIEGLRRVFSAVGTATLRGAEFILVYAAIDLAATLSGSDALGILKILLPIGFIVGAFAEFAIPAWQRGDGIGAFGRALLIIVLFALSLPMSNAAREAALVQLTEGDTQLALRRASIRDRFRQIAFKAGCYDEDGSPQPICDNIFAEQDKQLAAVGMRSTTKPKN